VKVVQGSGIYNFPIHYFVHFYSTFWSFTCSNRDTVTQLRQPTPHRATPRRRPRRPRRDVTCASRLPRPSRAFPRPRVSRTPHALRYRTAPRSVPRYVGCRPAARPPRRRRRPIGHDPARTSPIKRLLPFASSRRPFPPLRRAAAVGHVRRHRGTCGSGRPHHRTTRSGPSLAPT
jgi:hypothetical protein